MRRSCLNRTAAAAALAALLLGLPAGLAAQTLDVPVAWVPDGQAAGCASSIVAGLGAGPDGFLAVRSGPGTQYRQVDALHNGDVVAVCDGLGAWRGVFYGGGRGPEGPSGWVHSSWLRDLAG